MQTAILIVSWNPRHLLVIHITKTARVSFVGNCSISKLIALNKLWTGCQDPSMFFLMHACIHEFIKKKKKERKNQQRKKPHTPLPQILQIQEISCKSPIMLHPCIGSEYSFFKNNREYFALINWCWITVQFLTV